jgi:integrase
MVRLAGEFMGLAQLGSKVMARTAHPKPREHRDQWRIRWFDERGERQSEDYADYKDAEFKLAQHRLEVEEIKRGLRGATPPNRSFNELCDRWLATRARKKRSGHHDESIIRAHLRPFFGGYRLRDIDADAADEFIESREHLNEKTINNHLTLLIAMLNEAKERGWLAAVPRIRKFKIALFSKDYSWLRTRDEIARFLLAAHDEGDLVFTLYATAVYTGMRAGELAGLKWDAIDFVQRLIIVHASFGGPTKGGDVRYVPILDPLLPVLREWRLRCPGVFVFPNQAGNMQCASARVFQETLHRVLDAAGFPKVQRDGRTRWYIRFHDCRHSFASHWVLGGGDIFRLQKVLGHKSIQMTQRYAHLAPDAFVGDYGRLGATPPLAGATVVPLVIQAHT